MKMPMALMPTLKFGFQLNKNKMDLVNNSFAKSIFIVLSSRRNGALLEEPNKRAGQLLNNLKTLDVQLTAEEIQMMSTIFSE